MACAGTQPTLPPADSELTLYARSLGFPRLAAWYSLERSTLIHAPFSTGTALTQKWFRSLEEVGLLRAPRDGDIGVRRSLYEPMAWSYLVDWGDPFRLLPELLAAFLELAADADTTSAKVELWESLADAEIETYLAHQLRRHALDPTSASQIIRTMSDEWVGQCLARKRYLVWTGTRGAAAALLRAGMDQEAARIALQDEMRRRSRWLAMKEANNELPKSEFCFVPDPQWRRPILLETLLGILFPMELAYWTEIPKSYFYRLAHGAATQ